jgi:arylsulfatase A-like enzyme
MVTALVTNDLRGEKPNILLIMTDDMGWCDRPIK